MVITRFGKLKPFVAAVAATASGGEMMAPSTNDSAQSKPGITRCATQATAQVVKITHPIANKVIGRFAALKSGHDVFQAAEYKTGGRKMRKTTSGSREIEGIPGIIPMAIPAITSRIGYGTLILSVTSAKAVTTASRIITVAIFCMQ
jgi:hypothetical protein